MNWYKKCKIIQSGIEVPEADENLIRRVMMAGSGAVIHKMVSWIGAYKAWARLMAEAVAEGTIELFQKYKNSFEDIERKLLIFANTGKVIE